uniref:MFS domain-containing protein n=2 Tax=Bursaphelenchus xylophilus TaxID=6326 RepID=A0A1I7RH42_BURXY
MTGGHENEGGFFQSDMFRYFILLLGFLCLTSVQSNMVALNFTLICMTSDNNVTVHNGFPTHDYTSIEQGYLMWSVAIGSMVGTFPFSWLYTNYGARFVFFGAGVLSAFSTALIPLAASLDFVFFVALRFTQGFAYAADFAAIGVLCSRWASLKQNALFLSVLTCYSALATSFTNPMAGLFCESAFFGWPSIYYFNAVVSIILFGAWLHFYDDFPEKSNYVSKVELEKIHRNKTKAHIEMDSYVPYKQILTHKVVLSCWLNAFADLFTAVFMHTYLPQYIRYALGYTVAETGLISAIPTILYIPMKVVFGYSSDKFKCISERSKLLIFNGIAVGVPSVLYVFVAFVEARDINVVIVIIIHIFYGAAGGAFYKCATLTSRQYSHFVIASIQFIKCVTLFLAPTLMTVIVTDTSDFYKWRIIYLIFAVILFVSNIVFQVYATDEPASFTELSRSRKNSSAVATSSVLATA